MVQIQQPRRVDEGSSGFLGDLGKILNAAAIIPGPQQPFVAGAAAVNGLTAKQGSVQQAPNVGAQNAGAMQRRLQELMAPSPMALPPLQSAMQRRGGF